MQRAGFRSALSGSVFWLLLICLPWLAAVPASAAPPADAPAGFEALNHTLYTPRQGAPTNVNDLAQSPDGFLWLGTSEGLFRFDGHQFYPYKPPRGQAWPDADVLRVLALPSGEVWAGTRFGHLYAIHGQQMRHYDEASGLPPHSIFGIAADPQGRIWVGSSFGVFYLEKERWHEVKAEGDETLHVLGYSVFSFDASGTLWAVGSDEGVFSLAPGAKAFVKRRGTTELSGNFLTAANGELWFADDAGVVALSGPPRGIDARTLARLGTGRNANSVIRFMDEDGVLWGHSDGRLLRLPCTACAAPTPTPGQGAAPTSARTGALQRWPKDRELSGSQFLCFLKDKEGNIWVGTNGGLDRFHKNKFTLATADGMPLADVAMAAGPGGALTVGTHATGLLRQTPGGRFAHEPFGQADDNFITSLYTARDGTLWVGGDGELHRTTARGYERVRFLSEDASFEVQAMAEDREGGFWLSAALNGLHRLKDGQWTRQDGAGGLPKGAALSLHSDDGMGLWVGYPHNLAVRLQGGKLQRFGSAEGLAVGNVLAFLQDGPRMWIGGATGVAMFDGTRMRAFTNAQGEAFAGVSGLLRTPEGELWLNGSAGVTRIAAADLEAFVSGAVQGVPAETFGVHAGVEGLAENLRPLPSAAATPDGRLWFATTSGLYSIDPKQVPRNSVQPQVHVLGLQADGKLYGAGGGAALPAGVRALQIDYTATSFTVPELVRFRYRLEGVDADWQDAGRRRQAFYTNLQPGHYRFHVSAANEDGLWDQQGVVLPVVIPPAYWQTWWFGALMAALVALAGWMAYRLRLGTLARRARMRFEERLKERERIARELHDTLLQGTQGLVLSFQVAAGKLPRSDPRRAEMETILDQADQVVAEARDRVYDLRSPEASDEDLVTSLAAVGADLAASGRIRFDVQADEQMPPLREAIRSEAFMAGREALLNAFHHACAQTIELQIVHDTRTLRLIVRDDGAGIDAATLAQGSRPGHWGLVGMRERAQKLGGRLRIRSEPGQGTEICLEWPAAIAFESRGAGWRRPWRAALAWWRDRRQVLAEVDPA